MPTSIREMIAALSQDRRWGNPGGLSEERLAAIEARLARPLPAPVRELLSCAYAAEWSGEHHVKLFSPGAVEDVNARMPEALAGLFAFATDGGSRDYAIDEGGRFGAPGGVVTYSPGAPLPSLVRPIASDLPSFLRWMTADE